MKKVFWLSCFILFLSPLTTLAEESTSVDTFQSLDSSQEMTSESSSEATKESQSASEDPTTTSSTVDTTAETIDATDVIDSIQSEIGEATDIQTFSAQDQPNDMRQGLQSAISDGSITFLSQSELDQLTDEQLAQANQLALRYSSDTMGFDVGFLVKIVRALFIDQTLSWSAIEPQLVFDPSSYATFSAMIPDIDQLQTYLKTLYPANGIFLTFNQSVTDEWLASILTQLDTVEAQTNGESLFPGRIAWIIHAVNESMYLPTETTETTDDSQQATNTTVETVASSGNQSDTSATQTAAQDNDQLPKTNESKSPLLGIAGVVLILIVGIIIWRRKKK